MELDLHRIVRSHAVKRLIERLVIPPGDLLLAPLAFLAAWLMKFVRRVGVYRMTTSRAILRRIGVFPICDHYYEPMFHPRHLRRSPGEPRRLPGINLDAAGQLALFERFDYAPELDGLPRSPTGISEFYYDNPNFPPGDSEFLYSIIRLMKPAGIVEVGSGFSTLMMRHAIAANRAEDPAYRCRIRCIEPYEMDWLERLQDVEVVRQRVEEIDTAIVEELRANDIFLSIRLM